MAAISDAAITVDAPRVPLARHVAAVVVGNGLEFYDFLTYAFFAVQIGHTFFPAKDPTSSLLLSLATFGAGFFTRPLGGFIIGSMGDRLGRRPAMLLSFSLMGIAITGLALTPSYAAIGVAAPVLVIMFRLMQGFALGGEVGPTTAYLIEAAPVHRRGFYASLQYATQDCAVLASGLIGFTLANVLSAEALTDWGWRIAFLIGAAIVPFGLMVRRSLPETLGEDDVREPVTRAELKPYIRVAILGLLMLASATVCNYALDYMTTFANATLHMPANIAFGVTIVIGAFLVVFDLLSGWLSDRYGRKPVAMIPWAVLLVSAYPAFVAIAHYRSATALFAASAGLSILLGLGACPILTLLTETLPRRIRSGAVATIYALAISTFGGTTQFMITWIIKETGNPLAPGWYMTVGVAVGLLALTGLKESAPGKTGKV